MRRDITLAECFISASLWPSGPIRQCGSGEGRFLMLVIVCTAVWLLFLTIPRDSDVNAESARPGENPPFCPASACYLG